MSRAGRHLFTGATRKLPGLPDSDTAAFTMHARYRRMRQEMGISLSSQTIH